MCKKTPVLAEVHPAVSWTIILDSIMNKPTMQKNMALLSARTGRLNTNDTPRCFQKAGDSEKLKIYKHPKIKSFWTNSRNETQEYPKASSYAFL